MLGRARGNQERIIVAAHQAEMMARQKTLRPLTHYLPKAKPTAKRDGAGDLLAMMKRFKTKQDAKEG